jgi:hypothetical protein
MLYTLMALAVGLRKVTVGTGAHRD